MRMVLEIGCLDGVTFADKGNLAARSRLLATLRDDSRPAVLRYLPEPCLATLA